MNELITILLFGIFMEMSFLLGIIVSGKVNKPLETIKPTIKKVKLSKEEIEEREHIQEIDRINLSNIEAYNGTSTGQEDLPRY